MIQKKALTFQAFRKAGGSFDVGSKGTGHGHYLLWPSFVFSSGIHMAAILLILLSPWGGQKGYYKAPRTFMVSLVEIPALAGRAGQMESVPARPALKPKEEKKLPAPGPAKLSQAKDLKAGKEIPPPQTSVRSIPREMPPPAMVTPSKEVTRRAPSRTSAAPATFSLPPLPSIGVSKETAQLQGEGASGGAGSMAANEAPSTSSGTKGGGSGAGGEGKSERGGQALGVTSGLPGVSVDNPDFQFTYYLVIIQNKISNNWTPPYKAGRPGQKSKTVVAFRILRNGQIQDLRLEASSGASYLDQSALRAISRSSPLPPLPQRFLDESLGVHFSFELEGGTS